MQSVVENSVTHDLAWFRDNVQLWAGDLELTNRLIKEAIFSLQIRMAQFSDRTGETVNVSPLFTVFDYDDCPEHITLHAEDEAEPRWKWDLVEEGWGEIVEVGFGAFGSKLDPRLIGMVISLGGSNLSESQTLYLVPASIGELK